jgi:hypothetical protein
MFFLFAALHTDPLHTTMALGRKEFEDVMFTCVEELLKKTGADTLYSTLL